MLRFIMLMLDGTAMHTWFCHSRHLSGSCSKMYECRSVQHLPQKETQRKRARGGPTTLQDFCCTNKCSHYTAHYASTNRLCYACIMLSVIILHLLCPQYKYLSHLHCWTWIFLSVNADTSRYQQAIYGYSSLQILFS
jgi:hypothetical protein